jgi:hypothetical protein
MIDARCRPNGANRSNNQISMFAFRLLAYDLWGRDRGTTPDYDCQKATFVRARERLATML